MSICVPFICDASGNGACLSESIVACQCHGFRGALAYFGVLGWGRPSSCNGVGPPTLMVLHVNSLQRRQDAI